MDKRVFSKDVLDLDVDAEINKICYFIRTGLSKRLKRRGLVVAVSGGIDSGVTAALAARAIGADRVLALLMPEKQSSQDTLCLSRELTQSIGVDWIHEDITAILDSVGFYKKYDKAIEQVIPSYGPGWKSKITISNLLEKKHFNVFSVVAESPDGKIVRERLPLGAYLGVVAATNFKQRIRKMMEYYHADRLHYAVTGTPNRLEYDQGFFVKLGDGAADIKPIAHLYKTQVYALAHALGVPQQIITRPPTTDTYSLSQGQDEFYFSLPYELMDLCLYGKNNDFSIESTADATGLSVRDVQRVYDDIDTKRETTRYLHLNALLVEDVKEIDTRELHP